MGTSFWMDMLGGQVRYIDVDGVRTRILEAGDPASKQLILCIHGSGGHAENFIGNVVPFSTAGHVVAMDLLGHGFNSRPKGKDYTFQGMIDWTEKLVAELNPSELSLVGLSIGGIIAVHTAAALPAITKKLVLVCSAGIIPNGPEDNPLPRADAATRRQTFEDATDERVRSRFARMVVSPTSVADEMVALRLRMNQIPEAADTIVPILCDYDDRRERYDAGPELLGQVKADTLYTWGRHNHPGPEVAQQAADMMPSAAVSIYENSQHWPHVEEAAKFNAEVAAFLGA